jgi:hypothetical protein
MLGTPSRREAVLEAGANAEGMSRCDGTWIASPHETTKVVPSWIVASMSVGHGELSPPFSSSRPFPRGLSLILRECLREALRVAPTQGRKEPRLLRRRVHEYDLGQWPFSEG